MDKRAPNLTAADRQQIVDLVQKYRHVIENKQTDVCTNKENDSVWKRIESEYNAQSLICRTSQQLKQVMLLCYFIQCRIYEIYFLLHSAQVKTDYCLFDLKSIRQCHSLYCLLVC